MEERYIITELGGTKVFDFYHCETFWNDISETRNGLFRSYEDAEKELPSALELSNNLEIKKIFVRKD